MPTFCWLMYSFECWRYLLRSFMVSLIVHFHVPFIRNGFFAKRAHQAMDFWLMTFYMTLQISQCGKFCLTKLAFMLKRKRIKLWSNIFQQLSSISKRIKLVNAVIPYYSSFLFSPFHVLSISLVSCCSFTWFYYF